MGVTIGLDIGGSTTKIVGFREGKNSDPLSQCVVTASDPLASCYGGLGKFLNINHLALQDVSGLLMTGVGSSFIHRDILGIPTHKVEEFRALGLGGLYLTGLQEAVVVSMGTGTSMVHAGPQGTLHIIGSGVGGGTLLGLSEAMLGTREVQNLAELARQGDLTAVDLSVGDLSEAQIAGLDKDTTASNFGKLRGQARPEDLALGLINLVFQSVGTAAILASRLSACEQIVFVGTLVRLQCGQAVLRQFSKLYRKDVIIATDPEYATAYGAALSAFAS